MTDTLTVRRAPLAEDFAQTLTQLDPTVWRPIGTSPRLGKWDYTISGDELGALNLGVMAGLMLKAQIRMPDGQMRLFAKMAVRERL